MNSKISNIILDTATFIGIITFGLSDVALSINDNINTKVPVNIDIEESLLEQSQLTDNLPKVLPSASAPKVESIPRTLNLSINRSGYSRRINN